MIISASRRTDIPAFHGDWFFDCIRQGKVLVRNPRNPGQARDVSLKPDEVDGIVFWTKNPSGIITGLEELLEFDYYFQFTLNSYGPEVEKNIPGYDFRIDSFKRLSDKIGSEKVILRYDPVIITDKYNMDWHSAAFEKTAAMLQGYTKKCVISFVDFYKKNLKKLESIGALRLGFDSMIELSRKLADSGGKNGMELIACAEPADLSKIGIGKSKCVDAGMFRKMKDKKAKAKKDKSQRKECLCDESVDIGAYGTCPGGCIYCYANQNTTESEK
ncbi:DUF1848 domain-containing protein [candidate division WOR-3 bacterium]|nr:DUF1848 domain-containing protein [candidate division WOR-3 bacterium]